MAGRIYLDHHATTPIDPRVLDAMNGTVTIAVPDAEVEVGLRFSNGVCRVHSGPIPGAKVRIETREGAVQYGKLTDVLTFDTNVGDRTISTVTLRPPDCGARRRPRAAPRRPTASRSAATPVCPSC